jgi:succinoglycan biosynthesis protein ExoO
MADEIAMTDDQLNSMSPTVSIIIACRDVGRYIDAAIWSARRQSLAKIEILIVDDVSSDDTRQRIETHAAADHRLRLFSGNGTGPAAARNVALSAARGEWIGILDGDDIMHPRRLEWLLAAAAERRADIVAENQILFYEDGAPSKFLLDTADWSQPRKIDLPLYIRANTMFGKGPALGYLKPLIRRQWLRDATDFYDESLRIGEDYDFIARLLRRGALFQFMPSAFYFYRRHNASISHRLGGGDLTPLIRAAERFQASLPADMPAAKAAAQIRHRGLNRARDFAALVSAVKARQARSALALITQDPMLLKLLGDAAISGLGRRWRERSAKAIPARQARACLLLWHGDRHDVAAIDTWLAKLGWQVRVLACPDHFLAHDEGRPAAGLAELTDARDCQLVICNDARLRDCLAFLLAPGIKSVLVSNAMPQVLPDGFDFQLVLSEGMIQNAETLAADLQRLT